MYKGIQPSREATETMRRYSFITAAPVLCIMVSGGTAFLCLSSVAVAADDQSILQADHEFVQAAAKGDTATVGKVLYAEFTWTDADRKTRSRAPVLDSMPTLPLGNASAEQRNQRTYAPGGAAVVA